MHQWFVSYQWQRCWVEQTISIDVNKILPDLLKLRMKEEKQNIGKQSKGTVWR